MGKLAVIAIGGNSLIKDKDHQSVPDQYAAAAETSRHIAGMVAEGYDVVVTHGNGPQVGFILRRSELSAHELHEVPMDYCGADTQGAIGYMIQQALYNEFRERKIHKQAVTVVTQVVVDQNDPAFQKPSKPVGSFFDKEMAEKRKREGWDVVEDAGRGYRRVVASPIPKEVVEQEAIKDLIAKGFVVVAVGGGIPVVYDEKGDLKGVEAVIDKDYASALLASNIKANLFVISTAVEKVSINYKKPDQKDLDKVSLEEAKKYLAEGHFAPGSMGPKIKAIISFLEAGGEEALVTDPEHLMKAIKGETGTRFRKEFAKVAN
ncbi:MAG: carbamate kinase [bacterium]